MAAEAQKLLDLFDSYWFSRQILKKNQTPPPQIHKNKDEQTQILDFSSVPTINIRSYSDQLFMNSNQESLGSDSPSSVLTNLQTPNLQTILSGKEMSIEDSSPVNEKKKKNKKKNYRGSEKRDGKSRSLSELEFEEVKGFIDLGFVFSEKDRDSKLVAIIPGLQRLGQEDGEKVGGSRVDAYKRPYLSETWDDLEYKKEEAARLMMMIRIPELGNEMEVKHQLRFWAHSVASAVR